MGCMGALWRYERDTHTRHRDQQLRREALMPMRHGRHPCWLLGAIMALLMLAAGIGGYASEQHEKRLELRERVIRLELDLGQIRAERVRAKAEIRAERARAKAEIRAERIGHGSGRCAQQPAR